MNGPRTPSPDQAQPGDSDPEQLALVYSRNRSAIPHSNTNPILGLAIVFVVFGAFGYLHANFGSLASISFFAVCVVGGITYEKYWQGQRKPSVKLKESDLRLAPLSARLIAIGSLDDLGHLTDINDQPFEPIIVERHIVASSMWWVFGIGMFAGIILEIVMQWVGWLSFGTPGLWAGMGFSIATVILWIPARLRPVYYRIAPGRLDVMRFSVIGKNARVVHRIDLSKARIRVEFARQTVEIQSGSAGPMKTRLFGLSEPYVFVRGLFQAALCRFPAPPLPDDQLLE